jgi:hypothetical protein
MWVDLTQNCPDKDPELALPGNNEDYWDPPASEDDPQIVDKTQCEIPDSYTGADSKLTSMN